MYPKLETTLSLTTKHIIQLTINIKATIYKFNYIHVGFDDVNGQPRVVYNVLQSPIVVILKQSQKKKLHTYVIKRFDDTHM